MNKISNQELKSNNLVKKIALFYRKNNNYPCRKDNLALYNFLLTKRSVFKNKSIKNKIYPSDIEVAKLHGLPDDWLSTKNEQELKSNNLVKKLALFYRKNNDYPCKKSNSILYYFLQNKRRSFKHKSNKNKNRNKIYPSDIEVAKLHGLPDDWFSTSNEFESNQKIIKIAEHFKKHGTYPSRKTLLGKHLTNKRSSKNKDKIYKIYPSDIEVAKAHGLPDDWMLLINREFESNERIKELAQEFVRLGDYPNNNTKLGQLLVWKRHIYKKYIIGKQKKYKALWYPSDIEVAKVHGLPDDWIINNNFELESNQKVIKIAQYFKTHNDYPDYNCKIGVLLSNKRLMYKNHTNGKKCNLKWYPSDIEVAKVHGLPDDWIINNNFELESNQKVIEIAQYFKTHGDYPDYTCKIGVSLSNKRHRYKNHTNGKKCNLKWHPSDIEVAKVHGLPDDWIINTDFEKESNRKIILLAQEFTKIGNYPDINSTNGKFLKYKRKAFKHYTNKTKSKYKWHPSDIEVAKAHGLPDDWIINNNFELESNQKITKIAQYFKTHGIYPNGKIGIGRFLKNKRKSFKQHTNGTKSKLKYTWYPSDIEVAKAHGLPNDWMLVIDFEKESNQKVIALAKEFKKIGNYPDNYSLNGRLLSTKRQAFKHYINGNKSKLKWYPSDIEVAKAHGLPNDWMVVKKQKSSLGERKTNFILEKFNIKPIQQYRHKLCVNKLCLPFDFCFNKDNIHYFIEYNGTQHYKPIFGGKKITKEQVFKNTQTNDLIKLNFCKKNNYPLLVIPYLIKDFENLISEFLKTTQFDPKFAQPIIPNLPELN